MIKTLRTLAAVALFLVALQSAAPRAQSTGSQHLAFARLHSVLQKGQFNAVATDSIGNLYLLLDQKDGVRVLKTDASATTVLAQALVGAGGDVGLAMALDPSGNIYITGTSSSGSLTGTSGSAFASPVDTSTNSFVARFDASLNLTFLTFCGSSRTAAAAITATADAVFVTGLIYGNTLPVTPSGIIQTPAFGSFQNGFVEKFSTSGTALLYATYLSGATGDTTPLAIIADPSDNAYVAGFTTASGFPTIAALVHRLPAPTSGFLTKLTQAGDGITFSTFVPGTGITSLALDPAANNLLLSGNISLGQFPATIAPTPLVNLPYQVLIRMPLDGSAVLSSTIIAPGTQSAIATAVGAVWVDGILTTPLLPLAPLADIGAGFAVRVSPTGPQGSPVIDQVARLGGITSINPDFTSLPITLTSLAIDSAGSAIFAGSIAPTASVALLPTQTYDLPLTSPPTDALPSLIHDAVLTPGNCKGSLCTGSAAYLARIMPSTAVSLIFSTDSSPLIVLRNLGSTPASGLQVTATGFTLATTCGSTLAAGGECTTLLTGSGPGSITAQATNATTQTAGLAAVSAITTPSTIVFSPKELDFGVQTGSSQPLTQIITLTNLGTNTQTFISALSGLVGFAPYTFAEAASDCTIGSVNSSKRLAPGATCQVTLSFVASSNPAKDGPALAHWSFGNGTVTLTGYAQATALSLSSTTIDFGTQLSGGLTSARYLYLSNNSAAIVAHSAVTLPTTSPFTLNDRCPAQLEPHTLCQLQFGYLSPTSTSTDSTTLNLDQNLSVLITGETIPQPGVNGSTANPSLTVTPSLVSFTNAVAVTSISNTTQTVTIQNTGASSFPLILTLTGDFTDQTSCTSTLAAGTSCSVVLTFAPSQSGTRDGLLAVTAGSGTTPTYVTLAGTATPILPANNGTLAFGNIPIGQPTVQWYKVSQPFTTLTVATLSSVFQVILVEDIGYGHGQLPFSTFIPATTGSCLNCWLGVQFTPTLNGPQTASLTLASSTAGSPSILGLIGNGVSSSGLILTPTSQDFGTIPLNSSSAPALFTLTNATAGSVPITVSAPTVTGDFSLSTAVTGGAICGGQLAVNASCFIPVLFAPTVTGQRTGSLALTTNGVDATAALTGFGSPDPGIALNPAALIFSNAPGLTATQQTITVSNTSSTALQVAPPSNTNPAFVSTTNCRTLAPSATCTLTVTYIPAAAPVTDTLQLPVTSNASGSPAQITYGLPLSATYTSQDAGLQILPGTATYGPSAVNLLGDTRQFTLKNLTSKSATLAITLPREFVLTGPPCITLAPNASCDFSVSFLPLTNGTITGTLSAQATPTDGSASFNGLGIVQGYGLGTNALTIAGNILPGQLLNFGQIPSGQSAQQILTLTNTASAAITIRRVSSPWPFLSTTTCNTPLASTQSCTITISYTPLNQVVSGTASPVVTTYAGIVTIESDAVSAPDQINLAGTAAAAPVSAPSNAAPFVSFTASQNSLTFDTTPIGFTSVPQLVTLTNTGNTVIHIASLSTESDFTATGACAALVPGASCVLTITFAPQVSTLPAGTRVGALEIASDSSTSLEFLSLIGTASPSTVLFQPGALNFGAQLVGSTTTLPILITNAGTAPAIFNGIATTGDYTATSTCPATGQPLAPNANCSIAISFTPSATGIRPGSLSLASSVSTSALRAVLAGAGVQSHLHIGPASLSFSSTTVGATSSLSLTLANTGSARISALKLTITGDYAVTAPCSLTTLAAGASCSVTVAFTPSAAGTRTGKLTITSSDPTSPDTIALTGTGTAIVLPSNASFSLTVNGSSSATQSVQPAHPASYALTVTPLNGYTGTVVLTCSAVTAAPGAVCSLLPATVTLSGVGQSASVTINTVTSTELRAPTLRGFPRTTALCILIPSALFFWGLRKRLRLANRPASLFLAVLYCTMLLLAAGCGSGSAINLSLSPSGSYQYTVTASSITGTPLTQAVTLTLTIP